MKSLWETILLSNYSRRKAYYDQLPDNYKNLYEKPINYANAVLLV